MRAIVIVLTLLLGATFGSGCSLSKETKKLPSKKGGVSKGAGKKGGAEDSRPTAETTTLKSTSSETKEAADEDDGTFCDDLTEGAATCAGDDVVFFCENGTLYTDSCGAAAEESGYESGACFAIGDVADCFLCGETEDGEQECCTGDLSLCCNATSLECYAAGDGGGEAEPRGRTTDPRREGREGER